MLFWTDAHIRCVDGDEGVEAAVVEVSVSSSNSLFLELIHRDPVVHWNGFLEPQSSLGCITQKCVHWKSICETWEKAAVAKIMINQMSRHLARLVCLEFHLCVCWRRWCMLCLFSHGIGDPIHRQSSGGLQFWRSQRPELINHRNEHTTETQHVHPVFCLRLRWHGTGYGWII